jgi:ferritin-like metal-binding protein YciE
MKENVEGISTLQGLLDADAASLISAEMQLKKELNVWVLKVRSAKLRLIIQKYLDYIDLHIQLLNTFYDLEKINKVELTNRVMQAYIVDTNEKLSVCLDAEVKDACLLACIQAINHFKLSAYGTAASFANAIGMEKQAAVFHTAEINERQIDDRLSQLANFEINARALAPVILPGTD